MEKPKDSVFCKSKSLIRFENSNHFFLLLRSTLQYSSTPSGCIQAEPFVSDLVQRAKFSMLE